MRSSKSDYSLCVFLSMTPYVGIYPWVSPMNSGACSKLNMVLCERVEGPFPFSQLFNARFSQILQRRVNAFMEMELLVVGSRGQGLGL